MSIPSSPPRLDFDFDAETTQTILVALALSNHASLTKSDLPSRIAAVAVDSITEQLALRQFRLLGQAAHPAPAAPAVSLSLAEIVIMKLAFDEAPWDDLPAEAAYPQARIEKARRAIEAALSANWPLKDRLRQELDKALRRSERPERLQ